jgi:hypothetical protein
LPTRRPRSPTEGALPGTAPFTPVDELLQKVRRELGRYEHPLFAFDARSATDGVAVEIRFKPVSVEVHTYQLLLRPREIEQAQFPWNFQRQLYDCLHDYVIEMFTRNPQQRDG